MYTRQQLRSTDLLTRQYNLMFLWLLYVIFLLTLAVIGFVEPQLVIMWFVRQVFSYFRFLVCCRALIIFSVLRDLRCSSLLYSLLFKHLRVVMHWFFGHNAKHFFRGGLSFRIYLVHLCVKNHTWLITRTLDILLFWRIIWRLSYTNSNQILTL